uniref:Uncharacterized protein LOC104265733 n=1 Tax=Phallusia mammillata TaxID=59560 RepID=A0A6F9DI59_9ASCI|nr:uncharacterized protein LOC104265733 [Phallusia mammillata]
MSASPTTTRCCCKGNIPPNLLEYVNSFDTSAAEFACSVRADSDLIRVVLTWTYPERCSRNERRKHPERKQYIFGGDNPRSQFPNTLSEHETKNAVERNVPLITSNLHNGYATEENGSPNFSSNGNNLVAEKLTENFADDHSGDESTVSVSSLDSARTSDNNIKRRSSRMNSVATDTEDEVAIKCEMTTDDEYAERKWVDSAEIRESKKAESVLRLDEEKSGPSVFNSYCTVPLPSCNSTSHTGAKKQQNCEKLSPESASRLALSPIAEATASANDTDYNSDTTTENIYDVTPGDDDVADEGVKEVSVIRGEDATPRECPTTSGKKVSVAVFSLNSGRGKSPPQVERARGEDFVSTEARQMDILRSNRAPTLGAFPGYAFNNVTESQLIKLYKVKMSVPPTLLNLFDHALLHLIFQEHMNTLLVVRASKYRLSQKRLDQALMRSGKIDPSHVIDVYYDEIVMARPAYVVQFKQEFADDVIHLTTIDGKGPKGILKLSEDNEVSMSRPQPKMMEIKWRPEFEFL